MLYESHVLTYLLTYFLLSSRFVYLIKLVRITSGIMKAWQSISKLAFGFNLRRTKKHISSGDPLWRVCISVSPWSVWLGGFTDLSSLPPAFPISFSHWSVLGKGVLISVLHIGIYWHAHTHKMCFSAQSCLLLAISSALHIAEMQLSSS